MIVGRDREAARLLAALAGARAGRASRVAVVGEAGIGKTALLDVVRAAAADLRVVSALGIESEATVSFGALLEVVRPFRSLVDQLAPPQRRALAVALGLEDGEVGDRFAVGAATLGLLAAAAEAAPVVCLVDDAHWIDSPSREALLFAARRLDADAVLVVFAVRTGAGLEEHDLAGFDTLRLVGLDLESVGRVVGAEHAQAAYDLTGGNPLALQVFDASAPAETPQPLPERLTRGFQIRLAELGPATQRAMLVASAESAGRSSVIAAALASAGLELADLAPAERAEIITVSGERVFFAHPLVRSAAYHLGTPPDRRDVHRWLAAATAAAGDHERSAWHRAAAAVGPDEGSALELETVGRSAAMRGAHETAMRAFVRSAALTPPGGPAAARTHEAAVAAWSAGRSEDAERLLLDVRATSADPERVVDALALWHHSISQTGRVTREEELRVLLDAARELREDRPELAARLLACAATAAFFQADDVYETRRLAEEAFALATSRPPVGVDVRHRYGWALLIRGEAANAAAVMSGAARELIGDGASAEDLDAACWILYFADEPAAFREVVTRAVAAARTEARMGLLSDAVFGLAQVRLMDGDWRAGEAACAESIRLAQETNQPLNEALTWTVLAEFAAIRDDEAALATAAAAAAASAPLLRRHFWLDAGPRYAAAHLALARGDAERVLQVNPDHPAGGDRWFGYSTDRIEALIRLGRTEAAQAEIEKIGSETFRRCSGRVERCRGMLAADDAYEEPLDRSIAIFTEIGHPLELARTQLRLGERLRRANARRRAREQLHAAAEAFERLGAQAWLQAAERELAASGERLRRSVAARDELTPQELQIASLVAAGRTNREVATQVFLSPKTIESHLGRVYRKLAISSRSELAAALASRRP